MKNGGLSELREKDAQCMPRLSLSSLGRKIPRHLVSLDAKIDPLSNHERRKGNGELVSSCEEVVSTCSPNHFLSKIRENYVDDSEKMHKTLSSSQGTLEFANGTPRFVFKLENRKDIYVASLSSNVKDQSVYMIHLQRGESSSSSTHLVGRIKVSTLFSSSSRIVERKFVLFSSINDDQSQILLPRRKKNRGLVSKKVGKNTQSKPRSRCSWNDEQQIQEPVFENNFATNLERLAIVVKQEEESGGWGLKFLKKSPTRLDQTNENETWRRMLSMEVVMPSGIHGGPEDEPLSLIERWKSQGNCDCGGWDLGCSLTLHKGQCNNNNHLELFLEGSSKHETQQGLRIVNIREGFYFVQFENKISVLQSFSIALAFIHSRAFDT